MIRLTPLTRRAMDEATLKAMAGGKLLWFGGKRPKSTDATGRPAIAMFSLSEETLTIGEPNGVGIGALVSDATADGRATWWRVVDANGNTVLDGDINGPRADYHIENPQLWRGMQLELPPMVIRSLLRRPDDDKPIARVLKYPFSKGAQS